MVPDATIDVSNRLLKCGRCVIVPPDVPSNKIDELFVRLMDLPRDQQDRRLAELRESGDLDASTGEEVACLLKADAVAKKDKWLDQPPLEDQLAIPETIPQRDTSHAGDRTTGRQPHVGGEEESEPSVIAKYDIEFVIGRGSFGKVYKAFDTRERRPVALKVPRWPLQTTAEKDEFLKEARAMLLIQRLNHHPNIVEIYNADYDENGQPFIAMEYVEGSNLRQYIDAHGKTSDISEVRKIMAAVADAMSLAHRLNIVHRDLKPENILLDRHNSPRVTDFGLAIRDDRPHPAGQFAGTQAYMAPEQIDTEANLHGSTDVWALGVLCYELLTGGRPFLGRGHVLTKAIRAGKFKRVRESRNDLPRRLETLCRQCLAVNADDRPTAADVARKMRTPWKRAVLRTVILLAVVATAFAGAWAGGVFEEPEWTVDSEAIAGQPTSVLRREPKVVSTHFAPIIVNLEKDTGAVSVTSQARAMLQLDQTRHQRFALELGFEKAHWSGRVGVFWGRRMVVYDGRQCWTANAIMCECFSTNGEDFLRISSHKWLAKPISETRFEDLDVAGSDFVVSKKWLRANACVLSIAVDENGSVEIRCQRRLVKFLDSLHFENNAGGFGFVNSHGTSILRRAEFLIPEPKETP